MKDGTKKASVKDWYLSQSSMETKSKKMYIHVKGTDEIEYKVIVRIYTKIIKRS